MVVERICMRQYKFSMEKICIAALMTFCLISSTCFNIIARAELPKPEISSSAGILMDAKSGKVLYEKNSRQRYAPASITKIMTALLVAEKANMSDMVTYSESATTNLESGAVTAGVTAGDIISVNDSMYALMLKSANEVANGLAEHVAGSISSFAAMMTARAKEIGATDTNFANPSGLNDDKQYTSAYDMALITKTAFANETVLKISSTKAYTFPATKQNKGPVSFTIGHKMLRESDSRYYKEVVAGKTGYTRKAGNTLVTYAKKDGRELIVVILKSNGTHYSDTKALLDYGFGLSYENETKPGNNNLAAQESEQKNTKGPVENINTGTNNVHSKYAIEVSRNPQMLKSTKDKINVWKKDNRGWWYVKRDNSYAKSELLNIDSKEYWFDGEGYMVTGWLQDKSGDWFYFDNDGGMRKSAWLEYKSAWYYLSSSGVMLKSAKTPDGYKVNSEGIWVN